jgi:predicted DCC family thiol-disulfide oxidoreductase YuxK
VTRRSDTIPDVDTVTLLYDEDCGFCRWSVDKVLRWDRSHSIRVLAIQSAEGSELLNGMDMETRLASWHLVRPDGRVFSAGAAVPELAKLLPAGAPVALLARTFPRSTDRLYRLVARNRDRFGRALGTRACSVDPSAREKSGK